MAFEHENFEFSEVTISTPGIEEEWYTQPVFIGRPARDWFDMERVARFVWLGILELQKSISLT